MTAIAPYRSAVSTGRDGFGQLVHAEWTKFRTVRGWVIGMLVAVLVTAGLGLFAAAGGQSSCQDTAGPVGEPVSDSFYFVRQPLAGNGSLTGPVSAASPRWLRLTRAGDAITGYGSPDGVHWTRVGTVDLSGLPATAQAGLFATSPQYQVQSLSFGGGVNGSGAPAQDTAVFDHISKTGAWPVGSWTGDNVGGSGQQASGAGGYHRAGHDRRARLHTGRAPDPARARVHPGERLPAAVPRLGPGPAGGGGLGALPGADRHRRLRDA